MSIDKRITLGFCRIYFVISKFSINFLLTYAGNDDSYILKNEDELDPDSITDRSVISLRSRTRTISVESDFDAASSGYGSVRRTRTISELSDHAVRRGLLIK